VNHQKLQEQKNRNKKRFMSFDQLEKFLSAFKSEVAAKQDLTPHYLLALFQAKKAVELG